MDEKVKEQIAEYVRADFTDDEQLEMAWAAFTKLEPLDQWKLIICLSKKVPALTETEFFVKFANEYREMI